MRNQYSLFKKKANSSVPMDLYTNPQNLWAQLKKRVWGCEGPVWFMVCLMGEVGLGWIGFVLHLLTSTETESSFCKRMPGLFVLSDLCSSVWCCSRGHSICLGGNSREKEQEEQCSRCVLTPQVWCWDISVDTKRRSAALGAEHMLGMLSAEHLGAGICPCLWHLAVFLGRSPCWAAELPLCQGLVLDSGVTDVSLAVCSWKCLGNQKVLLSSWQHSLADVSNNLGLFSLHWAWKKKQHVSHSLLANKNKKLSLLGDKETSQN